MRETERIAEQLRLAFEGGAWHGPSLMELLDGISAEQAAAHPVMNGHSIWEVVLHVRNWNLFVVRRTRGEVVTPTPDQDWPEVGEVGDEAWVDTVKSLKLAHAKAYNAIAGMPDKRLTEKVPGKPEGHDFYYELHGLVQHDLYHAGQIALLKRANAMRRRGASNN